VNRITAVLAAVLILTSTSSAFAAAKPKAPFQITISAGEGVPVADADLQITCAATAPPFVFTGKTDAAGKLGGELADFTHTYIIQVTKAGYHDFSQEVDLAAKKLKKGELLELTVTVAPITAGEYYNAAAKALNEGDFALAQAQLELAVATDPKLTLAYGALAQAHLAQSEKSWFDKLKKEGKLDGTIDFAAASKQHLEAALAATDQALALDPADVLALNGRYEALEALGKKTEAQAALAELASKDRSPAVAVLLYNAGAKASNAQQIELAREHFQAALAINPGLHQAHAGLAELAIREKKYDQAVTELDQVIEISPRNFKAHERRIEVLKTLGDKERTAAAEQELAKLKSGG